jgi:D-3-phosphoglycerate dehydrogenase / 2-oxoglutarate reductase
MTERLIVLDASFGDVTIESETAAAYGVSVEDAGGVSGQAVVDAAGTADGVLVQYGQITADIIEQCPSWRVIGRYGVGVDNVDLDAATEQGIAVINVPDYCVEEVATHAVALLLAAWRKLALSRELIDTGRWGDWKALQPIQPMSSSTLGLIGIGRIGGEVIRLLSPFFERVISFDPVQEPPPGVQAVTLDQIFAEADAVSLHCPLTSETRDLVNAERLRSMKRGSLLVNVSRGPLIDTAALNDALRSGLIGGAALDVLPQEPPNADDPLLTAPNLLLTNHSAWYSEASLVQVRQLLAQRCCDALAGQPVPTVVNARELAARVAG